MAAEIVLDPQFLFGRNEQIVAALLALNAQPFKVHQRRAQVFDPGVDDGDLGPGHRRQTDQRADLDMIGADAMRATAQRRAAMDRHRVGADPLDPRAHGNQEQRQILHVRL